ncbi:MAG: LysR family transcriptional regulator [Solirubrobacterales bacterium]|jgi:DNA-binding transcriptional LysR family regulator|nr:LysR family transcriptional regulator [Solirubrobacterales bacterium]
MTIQQLTYFLAALDHGSFSAAAEELHMAQPSLSEQVRRLEAELGVKLFERGGRGLVATDAGRLLRDHAQRVLDDVEGARQAVVETRELRGGTATFGTWGAARFYPGTQIVADFRRKYPLVRLRLLGLNSADVAEAVREGELEVGMVALPIDDRGLDVQPIMRDELVYASADAAVLQAPKSIREVARAPLIMFDASYATEDPTRRQLAALAQAAGVAIEPQIDVEDVEMAIELAARGLGDTLVSRGIIHSMGRRMPKRLGWVPFAEPIYDTFAFIQRRDAHLSPASREFLAVAEARLHVLAKELEEKPPRARLPDVG